MARTMLSSKVTDFWKETISHQANHLYRVWLKMFLGQIILQHYGDNITAEHLTNTSLSYFSTLFHWFYDPYQTQCYVFCFSQLLRTKLDK